MKSTDTESDVTSANELGKPIKTKSSRVGRPSLFGVRLTQRELSERFNKSITDSGGRILTLRLRNRKACEALVILTKERKFRSESAAATWILEEALLKPIAALSSSSEKSLIK